MTRFERYALAMSAGAVGAGMASAIATETAARVGRRGRVAGDTEHRLMLRPEATSLCVLEGAIGAPLAIWLPLLDALSESAAICHYRPGYGDSLPTRRNHSQSRIGRLERLIVLADNAIGAPLPVTVVAHGAGLCYAADALSRSDLLAARAVKLVTINGIDHSDIADMPVADSGQHRQELGLSVFASVVGTARFAKGLDAERTLPAEAIAESRRFERGIGNMVTAYREFSGLSRLTAPRAVDIPVEVVCSGHGLNGVALEEQPAVSAERYRSARTHVIGGADPDTVLRAPEFARQIAKIIEMPT